MATKTEVLTKHLANWLKANKDKAARGELTKLIRFTTGLHPKSVPRAFRRVQMKVASTARHAGRPVVYGPDVTAALYNI